MRNTLMSYRTPVCDNRRIPPVDATEPGFDIISFHKGYATNGIQTNGLISDSVPPGEYAGFMFGFFGYWFGVKTSTGVYSSVTVAGLTIITVWLPIPLNP